MTVVRQWSFSFIKISSFDLASPQHNKVCSLMSKTSFLRNIAVLTKVVPATTNLRILFRLTVQIDKPKPEVQNLHEQSEYCMTLCLYEI